MLFSFFFFFFSPPSPVCYRKIVRALVAGLRSLLCFFVFRLSLCRSLGRLIRGLNRRTAVSSSSLCGRREKRGVEEKNDDTRRDSHQKNRAKPSFPLFRGAPPFFFIRFFCRFFRGTKCLASWRPLHSACWRAWPWYVFSLEKKKGKEKIEQIKQDC